MGYSEVIKSNHGIIGEEKFIISAKWWQDWCDYVNFESLFEVNPNSARSSRYSYQDNMISNNPVLQLDEHMFEMDKNVTENDSMLYKRPGKIHNMHLIDPDTLSKYKYHLKNSLQEYYDYIVINKSVWSYLSSWYNYDYMISKELVQNIVDPKTCVLNMYPDENEYPVEIKRNPLFYLSSSI